MMADKMADKTPTNKDVTGQMIWEKAKTQYPILSKVPMDFKYQPEGVKAGSNMMESYPAGETERPANFPLNRYGLAVFSPQTKPEDILGDVVSHYMVSSDPHVQQAYQKFQALSQTPQAQAILQNLYQEAKTQGETRPYEQWLPMSGLPNYFRGYVVNQWAPEEIAKSYTPEQRQILDQVKQYIGMK